MLVIDKASYHNRFTEESKTPKSNWRKARIITWLCEKGEDRVTIENRIVPQLISLSKKYFVQKEHVVDRLLAAKNISVLRLPTKHCEYNPIELVWAKMKGYVATHNTSARNTKPVIELIHEAFSTVTPDYCSKVEEHCKRITDKAIAAESIIDVQVRPMLINLDDDEDDDMEDEAEFAPTRDNGVNEVYSPAPAQPATPASAPAQPGPPPSAHAPPDPTTAAQPTVIDISGSTDSDSESDIIFSRVQPCIRMIIADDPDPSERPSTAHGSIRISNRKSGPNSDEEVFDN